MNETTGAFTADITGAFGLHIVGQGAPDGANLTAFTGDVTGDIVGTIEGMINAQGYDLCLATPCASTARCWAISRAGWLAAPNGTL